MSNVKNITLKPDKNNRDYKNVELDEQVHGKRYFNIFPTHTRYNDVVNGRAFTAEEFTLKGKFLELTDPTRGQKTAYSNAPSAVPSNDKLDQILAGQTVINGKLEEIARYLKEQPPF